MAIGKIKVVTLTLACAIALAACNKPNSAENTGREAGKEIDRAAEKVDQKLDDAGQKLSETGTKTGNAIEDAAITIKVKSAILAEPGLKVLEINVDTVGEVVTLTGAVDSHASADKAKQVASSVSGVKRVENRLTVK